MKHLPCSFTIKIRLFKIAIFIIFLLGTAGNTNAQLTGEWMDDNNGCYKIRQLDNRIYWTMDASPRVINVFSGTIAGNVITGTWADVPGGNMMGSGTLALRIESSTRMVKIDQTGNYGGDVLTKRSCGACPFERSPFPQKIYMSITSDTLNDVIMTKRLNSNDYDGEYRRNKTTYARRVDKVWLDNERRIMIETFETSDGWKCSFTGEKDCKLSGSFRCTKAGQSPSTGSFSLRIE